MTEEIKKIIQLALRAYPEETIKSLQDDLNNKKFDLEKLEELVQFAAGENRIEDADFFVSFVISTKREITELEELLK